MYDEIDNHDDGRDQLDLVCQRIASAGDAVVRRLQDGNLAVGDATSVNGGFQIVSNGSNGTGTVAEFPGSRANIRTAANSFDNTGIVSINSFDATTLTDLSATWNVVSQTGAGSADFFRTELLLQGVTSNGTGDGTGFRAAPFIDFAIESNGTWTLFADNGPDPETILFNGPSLVGGVPGPYSVTLDLDELGWEVSGTGFTNPPTASGLWSATPNFDFSDLQTNLFAGATLQTSQNSSPFLNVDAITVTTTPEPASIAIWTLLGIALGSFGVYRFRRKQRDNSSRGANG